MKLFENWKIWKIFKPPLPLIYLLSCFLFQMQFSINRKNVCINIFPVTLQCLQEMLWSSKRNIYNTFLNNKQRYQKNLDVNCSLSIFFMRLRRISQFTTSEQLGEFQHLNWSNLTDSLVLHHISQFSNQKYQPDTYTIISNLKFRISTLITC